MTTTPTTDPVRPAAEAGGAGFWRRRTGLVVPLVLLGGGVTLAVGTITMEVPSTATSPGPQVFPAIASIICTVLAVALAVDVLRRPEPAEVHRPATGGATAEPGTGGTDTDTEPGAGGSDPGPGIGGGPDPAPTRPRADRRGLAEAVGVVVLFIAVLQPVGWLLSGALLFWGMARALGSRRPLFDLFLALVVSSAVQLAFSAGLGLNLPPGVLAGVLG
ncbi:tripartite tricarboxylate transporter TctB family protein [Pseudonocardia sp. ICBG601]|uniref:tripartite tricarboxylate transporter TctB family protein n=1 Tax=Pseudonocardia sp. ICBG601 TaxID=2846759 RepID=UPI001CF637F9|nr:tripartite tricarboxylate transporter TctB family protein [Pseudonocardia sp. ICBG601]